MTPDQIDELFTILYRLEHRVDGLSDELAGTVGELDKLIYRVEALERSS